MYSTKPEIGKLIKQARQKVGLIQLELAKLTNVSLPSIKKYEQGAYAPKIETLRKIAIALDLKIRELVSPKELQELKQNDITNNKFVLFLQYLGFQVYESENPKGCYLNINSGNYKQFFVAEDKYPLLENIFSNVIQSVIPAISKKITNEEFADIAKIREMNKDEYEAFMKLIESGNYERVEECYICLKNL